MFPAGFQPSSVHRQAFSVSFSYPVVFCEGALDPADLHLAWSVRHREPERRHRVAVCIDSGVAASWPNLEGTVATYFERHAAELTLCAEPIRVPGGEAAKNDPKVVEDLLQRFAATKLDRQSCVIAIGGGAVLDAVGYAAALVHRGLRIVRVPTTVLAQNDAGIGVKNGINAFGAKNFLGTFSPPFAVLNDSRWLETLPERDLRAGLAEAVKVACIRDAAYFEWIEAHAAELDKPGPTLNECIRRCADLHLLHIRSAGDPFELGSARPLDYGHWAAHKLETSSQHALRHGEAVAVGMLLDARYAELRGLLAPDRVERLARLLERLGLPTSHPALDRRVGGRRVVLAGLEEFREHLGGELSVTLLEDLGRGREVHEMDHALVDESIDWLLQRHSASLPRGAHGP